MTAFFLSWAGVFRILISPVRVARMGLDRISSTARSLLSIVFLTGLILGGCTTPTSTGLVPFDVTEPGWEMVERPAIWRPSSDAEELVGELLLAMHPDGRVLVQFSKQWVPIISAQMTPDAWSLHSTLQGRGQQGTGDPPDSLIWFQIDMLPPDPLDPEVWRVSVFPDKRWRLMHRVTGETLEGKL